MKSGDPDRDFRGVDWAKKWHEFDQFQKKVMATMLALHTDGRVDCWATTFAEQHLVTINRIRQHEHVLNMRSDIQTAFQQMEASGLY